MPSVKSVKTDLSKMILAWREATGRTRLSLSRELEVSKTSVSNWELGCNDPGVDVLIALARIAEGNFRDYFLVRAKAKSGLTSDAIQSIAEMSSISSAEAGVKKQPKRNLFAEIPLVEGCAGAGPGYLHECDKREGNISVPRGIVPNPSETACIRIDGNSMEPTIQRGTIVAVDSTQRRIEKLDGKIVAARHNVEDVIIKRLRHHEGKTLLISDNPIYAPIDIESGWEVIGRVVWWIQTA